MLFMNEWDIAEAVQRHARHPVLSKATKLLKDLMDLTNEVSDGWPYWSKPCKAARKLQELIQNYDTAKRRSYPEAVEPTEKDLKAAVAPIKALLTREKAAFSRAGRTLELPC